MTSKTKLTDESNDRKYFVQVPQVVMALCRNPYDFTLWCVVKMIAGEYGECMMSTPDLAHLALMSTGKAHDSRAYLLEVGLLEGSYHRDPGYPQRVWHLKVPDIWLQNVEWRQLYDSLSDRIELREKLKSFFDEAGVYRRFNPENFRQIDTLNDVHVDALANIKPSSLSFRESSFSGELSHCERGLSQNERGLSQNERKKNQKEEPKEEPDSFPTQKPVKAKKEKLESPAPPKPPTPSQEMFSALAAVCKYDLKIITAKVRGQLNQTVRILREGGKTPAQVVAFEVWWYGHDWRGKKGQPPTLPQVLETWGQFEGNGKNGYAKTYQQLDPANSAASLGEWTEEEKRLLGLA